MQGETITAAIVQRPPVLLDRAGTLEGAVKGVHEAADAGAGLVVFPETYLPGYPAWIWGLLATIDPAAAAAQHRTLDVAGHYGRSDVFQLTVNRSPQTPISFDG